MENFLINEIALVSYFNGKNNIDLNIAFAIDENYIIPSGVLLFSILKNNSNLNIHFHIFTTCDDMDKFCNFKKFNADITIYVLNENYFSSLQTPGHFSPAIYYRVAIPYVLEGKVDNILYIDADVLCVSSLQELTLIDISDYYIAAVEDLGMSKNDVRNLGMLGKYFNSGVMIINVEKWNVNDIFNKFMSLVNERVFAYPDQDALNILFDENILYISNKYNHFTEIESEEAVLVHYVGWLKPWSMAADNNETYLHYYSDSPFKSIPLQSPVNYKLAKRLARKYIKNNQIIKSVKWYFLYFFMKMKNKLKS